MVLILLASAMTVALQNDPAIDGRTVFALFEKHHASFQDITFLHEGFFLRVPRKPSDPASETRFQSFYAYRSDGATLHDIFLFGQEDRPDARQIRSVLHGRLEMFDASPDHQPRVRDREPATGGGGAGSLAGPDSPERIFLAWYFATLTDPAEHDYATQGWEEVDGHRCLKVRMLNQPKSLLKGWVGGLPILKLWVDLVCGYPRRIEYYRGDDLVYRTEISRLERLPLPDGRLIWFPAEGTTSQYQGRDDQRRLVFRKEPFVRETRKILLNTVKFNQNLSDSYFSAKKHALVANDEGLRKLQRELEKKPVTQMKNPPSDPESIQKRLDEALAGADHQSKRLEASSAARSGAGWFGVLIGGLGVFGLLLLGGAGLWYWRCR